MAKKLKNPITISSKKTVQQPETRDTLPEKQMQTHHLPVDVESPFKARQVEEAQQQ